MKGSGEMMVRRKKIEAGRVGLVLNIGIDVGSGGRK